MQLIIVLSCSQPPFLRRILHEGEASVLPGIGEQPVDGRADGCRAGDCRHPCRGRCRSRPAGGGAGGRAGAHRGGNAAHPGFLQARALRTPAGGRCDGVQAPEPGLVLASLRQHALQARARLPRRQRHLQEDLGVVAELDHVVGRARAALQRARLPALPPQGRPRPPADRRPARRDDADAALHPAADRGRARGPARTPAERHGPRAHLRRAASELLDPGGARRGRHDDRLRGGAGGAGRRRDGQPPQAQLRRLRSPLRPAASRDDAVAARRAAGHRHGPAGSDFRCRHPRRCRPGRP